MTGRRRRSLMAAVVIGQLLMMMANCATGAFVPSSRTSTTVKRTSRALLLLRSSTAGQGGGIFYDGPQQGDDNESVDVSSLDSSSSSSSSSLSTWLLSQSPAARVQQKDVVIIGGGLAGLSAALYLSQLDTTNRHITVLDREPAPSRAGTTRSSSTVASMAAAGMLAPQSERLPSGPLLDLCLQSRRLYPEFCHLVETLAQDETVSEHLWSSDAQADSSSSLPPWSVGYVASGGFLAPAFAGDAVATWSPPKSTTTNKNDNAATPTWLDATQVHELEPHLHPEVVGGWWFPEDASVDARRLTCSLRAACVAAGVELQQGVEVTSLDLIDGHCRGVWCSSTSSGDKKQQSNNSKYLQTKTVLVANGAWMRNLLPVPLEPHKGQSLSLRMPPGKPPLLRRVLFAQDSYIVPKADGRIVVGATVEAGSYDPNVTPAGILHILTHALQLVPGLADLPMEETWVGLRPTTPDKGPILGKTPWDNLFLAGGYWRNGVLLAPKTGQLLAALLANKEDLLSDSDKALLDAFAWDRFTSPEGGAALAANARYAASMHPIQRRTSGAGVAAAVGTELGSYSTARSATEERQKDRHALFDSGSDDSLERAAMLGRQDAGAFTYEKKQKDESGKSDESVAASADSLKETTKEELSPPAAPTNKYVASLQPATTTPYEGSADAWTVDSSPVQDDDATVEESTLDSIYQRIRENKAKQAPEMDTSEEDERPDPGFRIYHVDSETGESREVPPYTTPEEMERLVARAKSNGTALNGDIPPAVIPNGEETPADKQQEGDAIFDGYQAIQEANEGLSEEETAKSWRELRMRARGDDHITGLDETDSSFSSAKTPASSESKEDSITSFKSEDSDLNEIYQRIRKNKRAQQVEMSESQTEERPDPGFRIYHVDAETGESREVPPYTTPEEMQRLVAQEKAMKSGRSVPKNGESPNGSDDSSSLNNATNGEITSAANGDASISSPEEQSETYNEQTYDGYTAIQQANARGTREEELDAMRAARRQNRLIDEVDTSQIGAQRKEDDDE